MLYKIHENMYHDLSPWIDYDDKIKYDPIKSNRLYFINVKFACGCIFSNIIVYGDKLKEYVDSGSVMVFNYQFKSKGKLTKDTP